MHPLSLALVLLTPAAHAGPPRFADAVHLCQLEEFADTDYCGRSLLESSHSVVGFRANTGNERNHPTAVVRVEGTTLEVVDKGAGAIEVRDARTHERYGALLLHDPRDFGAEVWVGDHAGTRADDLVVVSGHGELWLLETVPVRDERWGR